jgi:hypothetical protein
MRQILRRILLWARTSVDGQNLAPRGGGGSPSEKLRSFDTGKTGVFIGKVVMY